MFKKTAIPMALDFCIGTAAFLTLCLCMIKRNVIDDKQGLQSRVINPGAWQATRLNRSSDLFALVAQHGVCCWRSGS